jgi:acyl-CoA oxidase
VPLGGDLLHHGQHAVAVLVAGQGQCVVEQLGVDRQPVSYGVPRRLVRPVQVGLRDDAYHCGMVRFREEHMLAGVARRLKRGIANGHDAFEVFNRCQDHVIAAGRAHVDRVVLEAFLAAVQAAPAGETRDRLVELYDLHALVTIENERARYIEHGRLSAARSKAITALVNQLCALVRPHADDLVDAFGIPGAVVDVPMVVPSQHE